VLNQGNYIISEILFVVLGTLISGLGFIGVVGLGKITTFLTNGIYSTNLIQVSFIVVYGFYILVLCWLTGKYIVPFYRKTFLG
jgi:hypothetical protein